MRAYRGICTSLREKLRMQASLSHRRAQSGNSFGSCLFLVILIFGGLGFYYFNYFQWRNLENPHENLVYLSSPSGEQKNLFRKATIADTMNPVRRSLTQLTEIIKKTKRGTETYPEFNQEITEVLNRLRDGMNAAKLRTIPEDYAKSYKQVLTSYMELYQSANELKVTLKQKDEASREVHYKRTVELLRKGSRNLNAARDFYISEGI